MVDLLRLAALVGGAVLGATWLRMAAWSIGEWREGLRGGWDRRRSAWKGVLLVAQVGLLVQVEMQHVLEWGLVPDVFLPTNLVLLGACLAATWHVVRDPRRRRQGR